MTCDFAGSVRRWAMALTSAILLAGCGGGGGGGGSGDGSSLPAPDSYPLSVSVTGAGTVTSTPGTINCGTVCSDNFAGNSMVTLTAAPAAGQRFQAWGGACVAFTGPVCTVLVSQAASVTASFVASGPVGGTNFALSVAVTGSGSVRSQPAGIDCGTACNAEFAATTPVTLTATPAQGQILQAWGGACTGTAATCTVTMSAARQVTATFAAASAAAPAWDTAALLESNNDFNVAGTNLFADLNAVAAIDANGNALVLWGQSDGSPDASTVKVYSRRYVAGQGWSVAQVIPNAPTPVTGKLIVDGAGNMTWVNHSFEVRRFTPTGGWSSAVVAGRPLPSGFLGILEELQVDASGTVHVLARGNGSAWHSTLANNATQWAAWTDLANASSANVTGGVRMALAPAGAVAVWRERNAGDANDSIWAARRVGTAWQAKVRIEEVLTNARGNPAVAIDASGNALAAWHQGNSLYINRLEAATGSWGTAQEFDAGQVGSSSTANPGIAMHADGRAVVAWNSGIFALKAMSYSRTGDFTTPVVVTPYSVDRSLRMDAQGTVVLIHRSDLTWPTPSGPLNAYAHQLPWGGVWSAATLLESSNGDLKGNVLFEMNAAGQGISVWAQDDLPNNTVRNSLWANLRR